MPEIGETLRDARMRARIDVSEIEAKTTRLVKELFARNDLVVDDIVSIIFTSTPDLHAQFPASAARVSLGLEQVALLGAVEQDVPHGMPRCIRVLIHCYTDTPRDELRHVFLDGAASLRSDLPQ